jgi:hypothetical protein
VASVDQYLQQVPDVRPLYYAMLLFTEVTRAGSVIYQSTLTGADPRVRAWAVRVRKKF